MDSIEPFVLGQLAAWAVPGCAVAVVRDGKVVLAAGWGQRDLDAGLPVTPDTLFAIGSATKAFTAAAIGALVDDGLLEWDRPLRDYGHFWADFNSSGEEFLHPIGGFVASGNGTLNYYGVERDSSNHDDWDVLYNFDQINVSTDQGSSTGYEVQAGLEDSDVSPATSAANFTHFVLKYENTSGNIDDFSYQSTWVEICVQPTAARDLI